MRIMGVMRVREVVVRVMAYLMVMIAGCVWTWVCLDVMWPAYLRMMR